jgi:hypothetical protein
MLMPKTSFELDEGTKQGKHKCSALELEFFYRYLFTVRKRSSDSFDSTRLDSKSGGEGHSSPTSDIIAIKLRVAPRSREFERRADGPKNTSQKSSSPKISHTSPLIHTAQEEFFERSLLFVHHNQSISIIIKTLPP